MSETKHNGDVEAAVSAATIEAPREKLTKKAITADHPTWCPGCGDFESERIMTGLTGFFRMDWHFFWSRENRANPV